LHWQVVANHVISSQVIAVQLGQNGTTRYRPDFGDSNAWSSSTSAPARPP
jgi:hypothetical protein